MLRHLLCTVTYYWINFNSFYEVVYTVLHSSFTICMLHPQKQSECLLKPGAVFQDSCDFARVHKDFNCTYSGKCPPLLCGSADGLLSLVEPEIEN